jgi:hypothetical protein
MVHRHGRGYPELLARAASSGGQNQAGQFSRTQGLRRKLSEPSTAGPLTLQAIPPLGYVPKPSARIPGLPRTFRA